DPIWKMKTAVDLPSPFSVSVPVSCADELKWYTPGVSVFPPRLTPDMFLKGLAPFASWYVVMTSVCALIATALSSSLAPVTTPGGNPVTEATLPGLIERLPVTHVGPVLVSAEAPITVKFPADSNRGCAAEANTFAGIALMPAATA